MAVLKHVRSISKYDQLSHWFIKKEYVTSIRTTSGSLDFRSPQLGSCFSKMIWLTVCHYLL